MAQKKPTHVLEPIQVGSLTLKNRMIHMGSHSGLSMDDKGDLPMSPRWLDWYGDLAAGGFSLVSAAGGAISIDPHDENKAHSSIIETFGKEGIKQLSDRIHENGAYSCWQYVLSSMARYNQEGVPSYASSNLTAEDLEKLIPFVQPTKELTKEQIDVITDKFAETAQVLQECGVDAIEINAGHNHGLNTFISPAWNKRTDEYGGSVENRARILCEINQKIRARCGKDFVIFNNLSGAEYNLENGRTVQDTVEICKLLEASGADAIHCRYEVYHDGVTKYDLPRMSHELPDVDLFPEFMDLYLGDYGINQEFGKGIMGWSKAAEAIKKAVNIPVSVSGRTDPFTADGLIAKGRLDMISICRRAQADTYYAKKVIEGNYDDIRPCVGCNTCYDTADHFVNNWCMVNGGANEVHEISEIHPADVKKKVLVIGGGASGMEAARICALRGHDVILCDKEPSLGGTLPLAGMISDFHYDYLGFANWLAAQVKKLGVDIRLKTKVDANLVKSINPDVIFVAVGGAEPTIDIPGIDNKNVVTGEVLHAQLKQAMKMFNIERVAKLSKMYIPVGKRVALIGGAAHGLQTAHFLLKRGRDVVIIEESDELGAGMPDTGPKPNMIRWLMKSDVEMHRDVIVVEINNEGVVIANKDGSNPLQITVDTVVTTLPMDKNLALYEQVKDLAPEVYAVGDCNPMEIDEPYPEPILEPVTSKLIWPKFTALAIRQVYGIARTV